MGSNSNSDINAAYVASWQEKNPLLKDLKINGTSLSYKDETIDIKNIYMQDILMNPNIFNNIYKMDSKVLFDLIKLHTWAMKIKERDLENKVRRLKTYEQQYS